ncbi:hypothetical protein tb265_15860 [Gemmatimonadetes bacterium T265]|nr:hypothetical protein tb265_15860 [Gemmatimonadetes bacterium T265]
MRDADLIHVVEGGRVVESGTWDALLADAGRFRALCAAQAIVADAAAEHGAVVGEPVA